jgi:outer membrane protein assembly factor BamB
MIRYQQIHVAGRWVWSGLAAPSISAGVLYVANMDGKLYAFGP